jgi:hypothetical protein
MMQLLYVRLVIHSARPGGSFRSRRFLINRLELGSKLSILIVKALSVARSELLQIEQLPLQRGQFFSSASPSNALNLMSLAFLIDPFVPHRASTRIDVRISLQDH